MARSAPSPGLPADPLASLARTLDGHRIQAIRLRLDQHPLWLWLDPDLRAHYRAWRRRDLQRYIRIGSLPLVLLATVLTLASNRFFGGELSPRDTDLWSGGALVACLLIVGGVLLAQLPPVQRRFSWLVTIFSALLIGKYIAMPQLLQNPHAAAAESHFCMLAVIVATLALRLTWAQAAGTCLAATLLGLGTTALWADSIDWRGISYYFFSPVLVCLFIAWLFEEREKTNFLQSLLILHSAQEKETLNRELSRMAHQDALSGLANRREFDRRLELEWERLKRDQKPLSALFIDVDHFKAYNDHYGHAAGDEALVALSHAIAGALLRPADLAARYGGEEFVVLLPDTDSNGAHDVAQRIMAAINHRALPHAASPTAHHVTASIGVATLEPATVDNPLQLLELADSALYAAKQGGRWQVRIAGG